MPILIIVGGVIVAALLLKKSTSAPVLNPPTAQVSAQGQPVTLQTLQAEIAALTPKPIDPLAPKLLARPIVSTLETITPPISAEDALIEAKAKEANLNPRDFSSGSTLKTAPTQLEKNILAQIRNMHSAAWDYKTNSFYWNGSFQPNNNLQIVGQGTSMALSVTGEIATKVGSSIAGAIPFIGTAINGIVGIFSIISAHHKAAVQRDATAWNTGLSAVENYLQIIKNAVESGQSSLEEGIQALDSMYADFLKETAPARNNQPYANSVTEAKISTNALVIYWDAYYNALIIRGG